MYLFIIIIYSLQPLKYGWIHNVNYADMVNAYRMRISMNEMDDGRLMLMSVPYAYDTTEKLHFSKG